MTDDECEAAWRRYFASRRLPIDLESIRSQARDVLRGHGYRRRIDEPDFIVAAPGEAWVVPAKQRLSGIARDAIALLGECWKAENAGEPSRALLAIGRLSKQIAARSAARAKAVKGVKAKRRKQRETAAKIIEGFKADPHHARRWRGGRQKDVCAHILKQFPADDQPSEYIVRREVNEYLKSR